MKKIIYFLLCLILFSCSDKLFPEGQLVKTRIYIGNYISSTPVNDKCTRVMTTQVIMVVKGNPNPQANALCYVNIKKHSYDFHPDIRWQLEAQYFSWKDSNEKYMLKKNINFN